MTSHRKSSSKHFWDLLGKLNPKKEQNSGHISSETFVGHFKNILTSKREVYIPNDSPEKGELDLHFSVDELYKACSILKPGKATGIDNVSNEMITLFVKNYPFLVLKLFNAILDNNKYIPDWTIGMITPIFKKGSKSDPMNYRGITLLSCFGETIHVYAKQ